MLSPFTPQRKLIGVADKFGNKGIKNQQGTTRVLYDTLDYTGQTELRFFEGSAQRNFPLSNTGSDGNKLGVGNAMIVERGYITVIETVVADGDFKIMPIGTGLGGGSLQNLQLCEFSFQTANAEVIKNVPIMSWFPEFNKNAENQVNYNFEFDTQISLQPLLEFVAMLRIPPVGSLPADFKYQIRLTLEGVGAIIAPRTTF